MQQTFSYQGKTEHFFSVYKFHCVLCLPKTHLDVLEFFLQKFVFQDGEKSY